VKELVKPREAANLSLDIRGKDGRGEATPGSLGWGAVHEQEAAKEHAMARHVPGGNLPLCIDGGKATPGGLGQETLSSECSLHGEHCKPGCSSILLGEGPCNKEEGPCNKEGPCNRKAIPGSSHLSKAKSNSRSILHDRYASSVDEFILLLSSAMGNLHSVRLDSLRWETLQLERLFTLLDGRKLKEVLAVNLAWPVNLIEFPIDSLERSSVKILRLCFFRIPEPFAYQLAKTIAVLDISCCSIDTQHLYEFLTMCTQLKQVHIGFHQSAVKIRSESIELIQIWMSSIDGIDIEHAPSLKSLTASASPKQDHKMLRVQVRNSPALEAITCNISNQSIVTNGIDIRRVCHCLFCIFSKFRSPLFCFVST
jgi:hypothetical protein